MMAAGRRTLAIVLVTVLCAFHLWSVTRYPPPFVDEAWAADRGWAFRTTGVAFGELDEGVFEEYEAHATYFPLLPTAIQAAAMSIAGAPTLIALRFTALLFGGLLLVACHRLGVMLAGVSGGVIAVLLTGTSAAFMYSAHLARWDIIVAAAGYLAVALLQSNTGQRFHWSLLAGLLVGLSFEVHPHALIFVPIGCVVFLMQSGTGVLRRKDLPGWLGGLAVGAVFYAAVHFSRHRESSFALMSLAHGPTHVPPLMSLQLSAMVDGVAQAARLIFFANPLTSSAAVLASAWLVLTKSETRPVLLAASALVSLGLLTSNKMGYYAIYVTPLLDLTLAVFVMHCARASKALVPAPLVLALVGTLALSGVVATVMTARQDGSLYFDRAVTALAGQVQPGDTVIGAQTYWFGVRPRKYYSWEQLVYFKRRYPDSSVEAAFCALRPTVFIIDKHLEVFLADGSAPYQGRLSLPKAELLSVLDAHAQLTLQLQNPVYGPIKLYRISTEFYESSCGRLE